MNYIEHSMNRNPTLTMIDALSVLEMLVASMRMIPSDSIKCIEEKEEEFEWVLQIKETASIPHTINIPANNSKISHYQIQLLLQLSSAHHLNHYTSGIQCHYHQYYPTFVSYILIHL